jgi:hypothetical protein
MAIKNIEVVSIFVSDQDKIITDSPYEGDKCWIQFSVSKDANTTISLVTWFDEMKPGSIQGLILETDDIEKSSSVLKDKGAEIYEVYETPWGKFANFLDPDGKGWALHQQGSGCLLCLNILPSLNYSPSQEQVRTVLHACVMAFCIASSRPDISSCRHSAF